MLLEHSNQFSICFSGFDRLHILEECLEYFLLICNIILRVVKILKPGIADATACDQELNHLAQREQPALLVKYSFCFLSFLQQIIGLGV